MDEDEVLATDRQTIEQAIGSVKGHKIDDPLVSGWVLVAEFVGDDGQRYITRLRSDSTSLWQMQGMLHNALYERWELDE